MEISNHKKILFNYFEGKHTSFETKMLEEWLKSDANKELYFECLNEWELLNPQIKVDQDERLKKLNLAIDSKSSSQISESPWTDKKFKPGLSIKVAAAITAFFLISGYFIRARNNGKENGTTYSEHVEAARQVSGKIFEKQNLGQKPLLVNLPDGSSVLLQPAAKISYDPRSFGRQQREVIMQGQAFFEVYKDAKRPFIVYANEMIAKVLGTSFTIKAIPGTDKAEVMVKTGKVSVFTQQDREKAAKLAGNELEGIVLKPSEKIELTFGKSIVSKPEKIIKDDFSEDIETLTFNFEESTASEVFELLEKAYNVEIIYDKSKLASARLTAHLGDEPLHEKLKLICLALETSYQEIDDKIIILD